MPRQRVLDIQQRGQLPADPGAIVHVHALGTVYIDPQCGVVVATGHLHVHQLKAQGTDTGLEQLAQIRLRTLHKFPTP